MSTHKAFSPTELAYLRASSEYHKDKSPIAADVSRLIAMIDERDRIIRRLHAAVAEALKGWDAI